MWQWQNNNGAPGPDVTRAPTTEVGDMLFHGATSSFENLGSMFTGQFQ